MNPNDTKLDRYRRQIRFDPLGEKGQRKLMAARVLVCGCGALGSVIAETLVRAGVGFVRIVDRDFVELDNLHRQVLFDERDVANHLPKSIAAACRLNKINSQVEIEPVVADVNFKNIRTIATDADLLVDGTDNFQTRYLLNDFSQATGKPWIYGGCIGAEGQTMTILPGETPCLACIMPEPPPASATPTCETAGVLGPIVHVIASLQAIESLKILSGNSESRNRGLTVVDLWRNELRTVGLSEMSNSNNCVVCQQKNFAWLEGRRGDHAISLCGRNAVQILPSSNSPIQLTDLAAKMQAVGEVTSNDYLVRVATGDFNITVFADGRAIVAGTEDVTTARSVYARIVGA